MKIVNCGLVQLDVSARISAGVSTTFRIEVIDARSAGLAGATDVQVRSFAIRTNRVLVTLAPDFANLTRFSPAGTQGVIWLRPRPPTETNIREILAKWLSKLSEMDLRGRLAVVDADRLRVRGAIRL